MFYVHAFGFGTFLLADSHAWRLARGNAAPL